MLTQALEEVQVQELRRLGETACVYEKLVNQRNDFLHSSQIYVDDRKVICGEVNISNMGTAIWSGKYWMLFGSPE